MAQRKEKESLFSPLHSLRPSWLDSSCPVWWMSVHYEGWEFAERAYCSVTRQRGQYREACNTNKRYMQHFRGVKKLWTTTENGRTDCMTVILHVCSNMSEYCVAWPLCWHTIERLIGFNLSFLGSFLLDILNARTLSSFKSRLKTVLFVIAFY